MQKTIKIKVISMEELKEYAQSSIYKKTVGELIAYCIGYCQGLDKDTYDNIIQLAAKGYINY